MKYAGWFCTKLVSVHQILELLKIIWPPWPHTVIWPWQHHRTGEHFPLESALTSQLLSWQVQGQCVCDSSKLTLPGSHKVSDDMYSFWDEHSGCLPTCRCWTDSLVWCTGHAWSTSEELKESGNVASALLQCDGQISWSRFNSLHPLSCSCWFSKQCRG